MNHWLLAKQQLHQQQCQHQDQHGPHDHHDEPQLPPPRRRSANQRFDVVVKSRAALTNAPQYQRRHLNTHICFFFFYFITNAMVWILPVFNASTMYNVEAWPTRIPLSTWTMPQTARTSSSSSSSLSAVSLERQIRHPTHSNPVRHIRNRQTHQRRTNHFYFFQRPASTNDNNSDDNTITNSVSLSTAAYNSKQSSSSSSSSSSSYKRSVEPQVFAQRWVQLGYLSILALLSDWICFSTAAVPDVFDDIFHHTSASLIDIFLFTNVASCFIVTDVVAKFGLQRSIQAAAVLMATGCWFRSGWYFVPWMVNNILPMVHMVTTIATEGGTTTATTGVAIVPAMSTELVSYPLVLAGTVMVGAAQPFFQCTPPFLSATWFAPTERATSTAVALNFNQIGIATAFLVGGAMVRDRVGLEHYFGLITCLCTMAAVGTLIQFQNEPPIPPSTSELEKKINGHTEPPFYQSVQYFFGKAGFTQALTAFVCSISITNVVGTFIDDVMNRGGINEQFSIDLAGAGFEIAILLGGIFIGGYVDRTKRYKDVTMSCLFATTLLVIPLGLTEHAIGQEPLFVLLSLLGLGLAAGPIQPINAELAVDVVYPGDETAVESVQQIFGNLISALLVPLAERAARQDIQLLPSIPWAASDVRGDVILLVTVAMITMLYFSSFDAPLARSKADADPDAEVDEYCIEVGVPIQPNLIAKDAIATTTTTTTTTTPVEMTSKEG
jgi:MFS transporter, FLVCR family, MFS-domain-containing protein 7